MGKAEQEAGPLIILLAAVGESTPSVLGGLMGCGQVHSSSSSEDCWGCEVDEDGGGGS